MSIHRVWKFDTGGCTHSTKYKKGSIIDQRRVFDEFGWDDGAKADLTPIQGEDLLKVEFILILERRRNTPVSHL